MKGKKQMVFSSDFLWRRRPFLYAETFATPLLNNMEFSNYKITIRVDILHDSTGVSHKAVKISAGESM